jgi:hypothetical protein
MYQAFFYVTCSSLEGFNCTASLPHSAVGLVTMGLRNEKGGGPSFLPLSEFLSVSLFDTDRRVFYFYEEVEGHVISCLTTEPSVGALTLRPFPATAHCLTAHVVVRVTLLEQKAGVAAPSSLSEASKLINLGQAFHMPIFLQC